MNRPLTFGGKAAWATIAIILVPFIYFLLIGRYGWGDRDNGFMLSFAWRVHKGEMPYRDFIYVRPPVSAFVHSIWFDMFPNRLLGAATRLVALWQDWIIALLGSFVLCRYCFSEDEPLRKNWIGVGIAAFLFSACGLVPMPWYTTDGIFFGLIGAAILILRRGVALTALAGLFIVLSAGTKQSFYPLILSCLLYLLLCKRFKEFGIFVLVVTFFGALFAFTLQRYGSLATFRSMTSDGLHAQDALKAGFLEYVHVGVWSFGRILSLISLAVFAFCLVLRKRFRPEYLIPCFVLGVLVEYARIWKTHLGFVSMARGGYSQLLFDVSFLFGVWRLYKKREKSQQTLGFLLFLTISWCASISWGYLAPIMFSAPLLVGGYLCLTELLPADKKRVLAFGGAGIVAIVLVSSIYPYEDLDGRLHDHRDLGTIDPQLTFLVSGEKTAEKLTEFSTLRRQFAGTYVTLPAAGWTYMLNNYVSPVVSDWPENTEIDLREPLLEEQLDRGVRYAIVDKSFNRPVSDRFGVPLIDYVKSHWVLAHEGVWYMVYRNTKRNIAEPSKPEQSSTLMKEF